MQFLKITFVFIILFSACTPVEKHQKFDEFEELYKPFIQDLKRDQVKLIKYIKKGNISDTVMVESDTVNWEEELKLFLELKIPKSVYEDYEIIVDKTKCQKQFQTISNKHKVKNYQYSNCNGQIVVNIDVIKNSPLYEFDYHLELNNKGYLIEAKSNVELAYTSSFRLEGKFIK